MTTITLEVPDALASRLAPTSARWLDLIVATYAPHVRENADWLAHGNEFPIIDEILNFLASGPSHQQIVQFKVAPQTQQHLEALLDKNREGVLSASESVELDAYQQLEQIMVLLKIKAQHAIAS